jgi:sulfate transport system permease protein
MQAPKASIYGSKKKITEAVLTTAVIGWVFMLLLMPLYGIAKETWNSGLFAVFTSLTEPSALHSFYLTLLLTISAVVLNTVFGIVLAIILVRQEFKGKLALNGLIDLPFAVSPVVAGLMFITLYGSHGWIGSLFEAHGFKIIYAFPGMLIATLFVTFPFVVREIVPVLREYGMEQEEAAFVLGATKWQTFRKVTLPSIKWGLAYGITLTVARSIGEFGAVMVVSGAIINKTQTATLFAHQQFINFDYGGAFAAAVVLACVSFVSLIIMQYVQKRK